MNFMITEGFFFNKNFFLIFFCKYCLRGYNRFFFKIHCFCMKIYINFAKT